MAALTLVIVGGAQRAAANEIPGGIPYQGVLELGGVPVTGTKVLRFQVAESAGDVILWQGERTVELRQGRFSTFLTGAWQGKELSHLVAEGRDLYLRIAIYEHDSFVQFAGAQRLAPAAYAITPAFGGVPIGTVIDWFGKADNLPHGYMVADGRVVTDPSSPLNGVRLPNLVDKFVRGRSATTVPTMFTTGGSDSHSHTVDTQHSHSANHKHADATTSNAGAHSHVVLKYQGFRWYDGAGSRLDANQSNGMDQLGANSFPLLQKGRFTVTAKSSWDGNHLHTVSTPLAAVTTSTSGSTTQATTSTNNVPAYVGLLKLVRVK